MRVLLIVLTGVTLVFWYIAVFGGVLWSFYVTTALAVALIPLWIRYERRYSRPRKRT